MNVKRLTCAEMHATRTTKQNLYWIEINNKNDNENNNNQDDDD